MECLEKPGRNPGGCRSFRQSLIRTERRFREILSEDPHLGFVPTGYDLGSGKTTCLTCSFPSAGYFRVQYLPSGDYVLVGPAQVTDREKCSKASPSVLCVRTGGRT